LINSTLLISFVSIFLGINKTGYNSDLGIHQYFRKQKSSKDRKKLLLAELFSSAILVDILVVSVGLSKKWMSRNSAVGIATGYGLDD
jgi:hypothetical protein